MFVSSDGFWLQLNADQTETVLGAPPLLVRGFCQASSLEGLAEVVFLFISDVFSSPPKGWFPLKKRELLRPQRLGARIFLLGRRFQFQMISSSGVSVKTSFKCDEY